MSARDLDVECPVCAETMAEPRVLPGCGHTFCAVCVEGCVRVGQLRCPTCRAPFLADEVRPNFALRDLIAGVVLAEELSHLTVRQLRARLHTLGLGTEGRKADLAARLIANAAGGRASPLMTAAGSARLPRQGRSPSPAAPWQWGTCIPRA